MNIAQAVRRYLAPQPDRYLDSRTGSPSERDLITAAKLAADWRRDGPAATAAIFYALHVNHKYSHGRIQAITDLSTTTIARLIEKHRGVVADG